MCGAPSSCCLPKSCGRSNPELSMIFNDAVDFVFANTIPFPMACPSKISENDEDRASETFCYEECLETVDGTVSEYINE